MSRDAVQCHHAAGTQRRWCFALNYQGKVRPPMSAVADKRQWRASAAQPAAPLQELPWNHLLKWLNRIFNTEPDAYE